MASFNQNMAIAGLGSFALIPAPAAGNYFIEGKITLPTIIGGGGASECVAVVEVNNVAKYTGGAGAEGFRADLLLAVGDVVEVVLSSAALVDQPKNAIKGAVAFGQGV